MGYDGEGRPAPLIDQAHRLMHLWRAGDVVRVDEYLDARGLRRNALFHQLLQALIELASAVSEERSLLESISNHISARPLIEEERSRSMFMKLADHPKIVWPPSFASSYGPGSVFLTATEMSKQYVLKQVRLHDDHGQPPLQEPESRDWFVTLVAKTPDGSEANASLGGPFDWKFAQLLRDKLCRLVDRRVADAGAIELENA